MRRAVAREMARVLRPGGVVVSYDFRVARDRRNTRPLRAAELIALFPGFTVDARRVTLIPPLARALAGRSWMLCELLEAIPLLRTHELVLLGKPDCAVAGSGGPGQQEDAMIAERLALNGGEPFRATWLPFHRPCIEDDEIAEVVDTLRGGWLTTGPRAKRFEKEFAEYIGAKYAVAFNSATAAMHLALEAIGLRPGDEVIVPAYTFTATAEVVLYFEATPVIVDVDPLTLNIDPAAVEAAITERTRAIMPVDMAGVPCEYDAAARARPQAQPGAGRGRGARAALPVQGRADRDGGRHHLLQLLRHQDRWRPARAACW